ncbi:MAG TPA: TonB-dependent receptor [Candidatus Acidoferrum sp.]|nr:TonB-dependent receptor [Candidatus Acidoferrum sp.]
MRSDSATGTRVAMLTVAYLWCVAGLGAQTLAGTGSITGTVRDPQGLPISAAAMEVVNQPRGIKRTAVTNAAGTFAVVALDPAEGYMVTVNRAGFAVQELYGVVVVGGEVTNLDVTLTLSAQRVRLSVDESAPAVDLTKTEVSQVIRSWQILNLPINGRRADTYVLLTPAVAPDGALGLVSFRGLAGGNSFLTDGNDTSNQFFDENAGRTRISTQISQDAVLEFQVLSTGYSAEFGRASGGIINTVTRSGSNDTHGTAYWFFRNRALDARDPHSPINPPEQRTQFGASLGGRIVKDKLMYFANVEIHRRDFPLVASLARPPLFDANGAFEGTCGASTQQCASALAFVTRGTGVLPRRADSELGFGKLDWLPSQQHRLSASFNYLRWISPNGFQTQSVLNNGEGYGANGDSSVRTRYGRLEWKYIPDGTRINEFRFGWFKDRHADNLNQSLVPGATGLINLTVEGQANLGVSSDLPRLDPSENRFQLADGVTWIHDRHTFRFGFDWLNTEDYLRYLPNQNGSYLYGTFTDFALDFTGNTTGARHWQSYSQRFGAPVFDASVRDYSAFAEDQFRIRPHITLQYGVRYEYTDLPQPRQENPEYPGTGHIPPRKTNFAPRLGGVWAIDRARTVLRGGFGIFYARYHSGLLSTFFQENGIGQSTVHLDKGFFGAPASGPVFPLILPAFSRIQADPSVASNIDLTLPSSSYRNPYTYQADVAVERAISNDLNLSVSWISSRALHLTTVRDLNIGKPGSPVTYSILDAHGKMASELTLPTYRLANRVNTNWRRVNSVESGGNSYYNALAVQVRKRASHGIEGFLAYTWSHAIDFNQGGGADNIFFSDGPRTLWNGDYRGEKASSQLDQRHRLVISSTWEPKFAHGWRLSQISTFASTQPATPVVLVNGAPFPGAAFNTTLNGFGGSARVPFWAPGSLPIGTVARTDARLTKVFPLSERFQLHANFEAFNVFNRVATTQVSTVAYIAENLTLRPIAGLGAPVASQGYPDGTNARRAQVSIRVLF